MSDQQAESNEESISRQFWIPFAKTKYFSSVAPDPTAVEWLDGELDALAEVTRLVKRRRNDCAHVSRLPQEVLVRIFRAMERPQRRMLYYSRFSYDLGWMLVTHVCQYWREVALDNSSLWSTLRCADVSPAWGTEIMKRSKQAPLNVEVSTASDRSSARQPSIKDILEEIMTSHSHHLRNLKLVGAGSWNTSPLYVTPKLFRTSRCLLSRGTNALRRLFHYPSSRCPRLLPN
ncbi:hypothetical protein OF83DRAFT_1212105 [Amylostereum chailletii]|nr:hypothetical protein OF83DRAFT_1212105 [Amylostereum chailletii]